jgi:tetratricopeptide (TPR) repeat protein
MLSWAAMLGPVPAARADVESEILFHRGVAAYGQQDLDAARHSFEAVLEARPDDPTTLRYLGLIAAQRGQTKQAADYLRRAIELQPDDAEILIELAKVLLAAGANESADATLQRARVLDPTNGRAHLLAGIAAYRQVRLGSAISHLEDAIALEPSLEAEAQYYTGLAEARRGDLRASDGAFAVVEETAAGRPIGESARRLRDQMAPRVPTRVWYASTTAGFEYDTNPTLSSNLVDSRRSVAGSIRLRGLVDAYRGGGITLRAGYDGYFVGYSNAGGVNQTSQIASALLLYDYRIARFSLSYEYDYTWLSFSGSFRGVQSVSPTVNLREGRWGTTQLFYRLHYFDFFEPPIRPEFDRDGPLHTLGLSQIINIPGPRAHVRVGVGWSDYDTAGSEFAYDGIGAHVGAGIVMPWYDIGLSALYEYARQSFKNPSVFPIAPGLPAPFPGQGVRNEKNVHVVSFNLSVAVWRSLTASLSGRFMVQSSEVRALAYDQSVIGTYVAWSF